MKERLKACLGLKAYDRKRRRCCNVLRSVSSPYVRFAAAGHFYSPLPSVEEVRRDRDLLFRRDVPSLPGIELRPERQEREIHKFAKFYSELGFPETQDRNYRYFFKNGFFGYGDGIVLYSILREYEPRRVVEVGSGFSSALMMDTNQRFLHEKVEFTFIEPFPERLLKLLWDGDHSSIEIVERPVQQLPVETFRILQSGDILFIDSSHVAKIGSDVCYLLFSVLPSLEAGVLVHIHDVVWPFEYPEHWLMEGRAWNEAYFLRAFLQYNDCFEILYFNSYMVHTHAELLREYLPLCLNGPGGSIWLRKVR